MADKLLRRVESSKPWADDLNRLIDTLIGNGPGRVKLWNDDGNVLDPHSGDVLATDAYPLDVKSNTANHLRIRKSDDSGDVLAVTDAGLTLDALTVSTLTVSSLTVTGVLEIADDELGFFGSPPNAKQVVTGSRGGNAALASLLSALANYGMVTNSTTA